VEGDTEFPGGPRNEWTLQTRVRKAGRAGLTCGTTRRLRVGSDKSRASDAKWMGERVGYLLMRMGRGIDGGGNGDREGPVLKKRVIPFSGTALFSRSRFGEADNGGQALRDFTGEILRGIRSQHKETIEEECLWNEGLSQTVKKADRVELEPRKLQSHTEKGIWEEENHSSTRLPFRPTVQGEYFLRLNGIGREKREKWGEY